MRLFKFLFGYKKTEFLKEDLIGNWEALKLNGEPISKHGFAYIRMHISIDSISISTGMNIFDGITTESIGTWKLSGKVFQSEIGESIRESKFEIREDNLTFEPDPLFKVDTVFKSEYRRIK